MEVIDEHEEKKEIFQQVGIDVMKRVGFIQGKKIAETTPEKEKKKGNGQGMLYRYISFAQCDKANEDKQAQIKTDFTDGCCMRKRVEKEENADQPEDALIQKAAEPFHR
jgi:hypothetical protein